MARLADAGIAAIHSPAFEIEHEPEALIRDRIGGLTAFDMAIVTSPVAARIVAERSADSSLSGLRFFAPGRGTASLLVAAGLRCGFPAGGGTSEHILAMPDFADVDGARIAIVGAPGGRGLLASELSGRGADVVPVHVYQRKSLPPAPSLIETLRLRQNPVVLISSRQAFEMITDALDEASRAAWLDSRFVVSSARLERLCSEAGATRIRCAAGAADEQMLETALGAGWMSE